jgi:hypothetical protein
MATAQKAYDEIVELQRNKAGELSEDEAEELERLGQVDRFMQRVKARARRHAAA